MSIWYTVLTCTPISPKFPHVYHHTSQKSDKIRKDHEIVILFIGKSYIKIRRSHEFGTILWSTVDHEFSVPNFCTIGVSDRRPWKGAPFLDPQFHPVQQVAGNPLHSVLFSWTIQTWALHFIRKVAIDEVGRARVPAGGGGDGAGLVGGELPPRRRWLHEPTTVADER